MQKIFGLLRRVVWAAVLSVVFCGLAFWAAVEGEQSVVLASGFSAAAFALLSLRASR